MPELALPSDVALAIERLYDAFARYPFANTAPCACCHSDEEVDRMRARLSSVPLRELTPIDVSFVLMEILPMWGDDADVKHVMPRLLELGSRCWLLGDLEVGLSDLLHAISFDASLALGTLHRGAWLDWPADERQAVEAFLRAVWNAALSTGTWEPMGSTWTDEALVIAILSLVPDPTPYLDGFLVGTSPARHLAWSIRALLWPDPGGDLGVLARDQADARRAEVVAWVHAGPPREALHRAIDDPASQPFRWELVLGLEQLRTSTAIPFDHGRYGGWVPDAAARARAAELGVALDRAAYHPPGD